MVRWPHSESGDRVSVNPSTDPNGAAEFNAAKRAARETRRAFALSPVSAFVRVMQGAIRQYLEARAQGVEVEHGIAGLEAELRGAWPKSVSKFKPLCDACEDTGYRELVCWDRQRCGREVCAKNPDRQHPYVVPCDCAKGDRMRRRIKSTDDALAAIGKTQKKRGFSRMGQ